MKNIRRYALKLIKLCLYTIFALMILLAVSILALLIFEPDFLHIDSCLDAGGRWDYDARICEVSEQE